MDFDKLITLTVEENEKCKTEILRHKTKMVEKPTCAICSINTANCDCDKCGVWGCYDCVANKNDEYNICDECSEPAMADTHPTKKGKACCDVCWDIVDPPQEEEVECVECSTIVPSSEAELTGTEGWGLCDNCLDEEEEDINHPDYKDKTNYHEYTREECEYHNIDYDELHADDE